MTGKQLKTLRKKGRLTQLQAAGKLGVSQAYLSLLEAGKRPLTDKFKKKAAKVFHLSPTELPTKLSSGELPRATDDQLAADLADLGYVGFGHLRRKRPVRRNPAEVLLTALNARQRDARVVEGLPWLMLKYPDMRWDEVARAARTHDLQNRLGFVVSLAREVAESRGRSSETVRKLREREAELERSMLAGEDTLCNEAMTNAERRWLADNRPQAAKHWRVLTSLSPDLVRYAD